MYSQAQVSPAGQAPLATSHVCDLLQWHFCWHLGPNQPVGHDPGSGEAKVFILWLFNYMAPLLTFNEQWTSTALHTLAVQLYSAIADIQRTVDKQNYRWRVQYVVIVNKLLTVNKQNYTSGVHLYAVTCWHPNYMADRVSDRNQFVWTIVSMKLASRNWEMLGDKSLICMFTPVIVYL